MMPKASTGPPATIDDEAEDHEPVPVPKKAVVTKKAVVAKAGVKKV
jgi:hypothetical protein